MKRIQTKIQQLLDEAVVMGVFTKNMVKKLFVEHPITPIYHSLP